MGVVLLPLNEVQGREGQLWKIALKQDSPSIDRLSHSGVELTHIFAIFLF